MDNHYHQSPFESDLRELIVKEKINQPLVFRGIHKNWEPCTWTLEKWGELFKDQPLSVRYGRKAWNAIQPQWESRCENTELTWKEIMDWNNEKFLFLKEHGTPSDIWLYYSYQYLPDVFNFYSGKSEKDRDFLKIINFNESLKKKFCWNKLGFPDRNSDHSTLWIGSAGSYTPCHFDTYSCNLVCQVFGRKRWVLFPPEDTENLLPTRIPYEESSVYSGINFDSKKRLLDHDSELKKCTPYIVILEPGDCLFLPPKWWHFVKSEDFSISVNTWIELPRDDSVRVEEAILRSCVSTVVNMSFPENAKDILNPNEMDVADMSEMDLNELLRSASASYLESQRIKTLESSASSSSKNNVSASTASQLQQSETENCTSTNQPPTKKSRPTPSGLNDFLSRHKKEVECLTSVTDHNLLFPKEDYCTDDTAPPRETVNTTRSPSYLHHLINAVGHPSILKQITEQFLKNVAQHPPK